MSKEVGCRLYWSHIIIYQPYHIIKHIINYRYINHIISSSKKSTIDIQLLSPCWSIPVSQLSHTPATAIEMPEAQENWISQCGAPAHGDSISHKGATGLFHLGLSCRPPTTWAFKSCSGKYAGDVFAHGCYSHKRFVPASIDGSWQPSSPQINRRLYELTWMPGQPGDFSTAFWRSIP